MLLCTRAGVTVREIYIGLDRKCVGFTRFFEAANEEKDVIELELHHQRENLQSL